MQCLLEEPRCAPQLPDLMLFDEDDATNDNWTVGLANFCAAAATTIAAGTSGYLPGGLVPMASAPVPITSRSRPLSPGGLVDSLESTQTLLGSSYQDSTAQQQQQCLHQVQQFAMRFVPVPVAQPQAQAYLQQAAASQQQQQQYWAAAEAEPALFGGYGAMAAPQPYQAHPTQPRDQPVQPWQFSSRSPVPHYQGDTLAQFQLPPVFDSMPAPAQQAYAPAGWDLPPTALPVPSTNQAAVHHASGGISSLDMQYGYSAQFGQQPPLPIPAPAASPNGRMRRAASEKVLPFDSQGTYYDTAFLTTVAEAADGMGSEGSDADTLGQHHHEPSATIHSHHTSQHSLPLSRSAPAASMMVLDRSHGSRRSFHSSSASRGTTGGTASPGPICLKVKAARPRPSAGAARVAAAGAAAGSPRPARLSARRSMALSAAAVADESDYASDSDAEPAPSAEASEERRSGGSSGGTAVQQSTSAKKKHNPWSLTETEALVEGVRLLGPSKWAEIKKLAVGSIAELLANRSAVDLKDKWRNLTRVAKLPKSVLKARAHKSTSDIPLDLLLTVKDLMEVGRD